MQKNLAIIFSLPVVLLALTGWHIPVLAFGINLDYWIQALLTMYVVLVISADMHHEMLAQLRARRLGFISLVSVISSILLFYSLWAMLSGREVYFVWSGFIMTSFLVVKNKKAPFIRSS